MAKGNKAGPANTGTTATKKLIAEKRGNLSSEPGAMQKPPQAQIQGTTPTNDADGGSEPTQNQSSTTDE